MSRNKRDVWIRTGISVLASHQVLSLAPHDTATPSWRKNEAKCPGALLTQLRTITRQHLSSHLGRTIVPTCKAEYEHQPTMWELYVSSNVAPVVELTTRRFFNTLHLTQARFVSVTRESKRETKLSFNPRFARIYVYSQQQRSMETINFPSKKHVRKAPAKSIMSTTASVSPRSPPTETEQPSSSSYIHASFYATHQKRHNIRSLHGPSTNDLKHIIDIWRSNADAKRRTRERKKEGKTEKQQQRSCHLVSVK